MLLLASLFGCTPGTTENQPPIDTAAPTARVSGSVSGPDGEPLVDHLIQACARYACHPAFTDDDGVFTLPTLPLGDWTVKLATSSAGHSSAVVPLTVTADRELSLVLPLLEPEVPVPASAEPHDVAPGLSLTLSAAQVPGIPAVAAARIGSLPPLEGLTGEPLAGFYLAPLGAGVDVPFTAAVPGATAAWCTAEDAQGWVRCEDPGSSPLTGTLPHFGTLVLTGD